MDKIIESLWKKWAWNFWTTCDFSWCFLLVSKWLVGLSVLSGASPILGKVLKSNGKNINCTSRCVSLIPRNQFVRNHMKSWIEVKLLNQFVFNNLQKLILLHKIKQNPCGIYVRPCPTAPHDAPCHDWATTPWLFGEAWVHVASCGHAVSTHLFTSKMLEDLDMHRSSHWPSCLLTNAKPGVFAEGLRSVPWWVPRY